MNIANKRVLDFLEASVVGSIHGNFILRESVQNLLFINFLHDICHWDSGTELNGTLGKRGIKQNPSQNFRPKGHLNVKEVKSPCKKLHSMKVG